jgi:L-alanine-DL-glutamate epimerase-like enolase superfamily enzyme
LTGAGRAGHIRVMNAGAVARIETFPLRIPFRPDGGEAARPPVDSLLVKVTTTGGLSGWGEAFGFEATPVTRRAVEDLISPLCAGQDAGQIGPLMRAVQERLQVFGRGGTVIHALSAVDTALWDIAGKAAGVPLHRLLGGGGTHLPCYASLDPYGDPAAVRAAVGRALDEGFTSVKLHERELPAVRAAREEAGDDTSLMLDVNCPWTLTQARERANGLRELRLRWLEEPLWPPEDYAGLARLRASCGIPVAAGENVATLLDFGRLMGAGAVDFVQPSPAKMGGVTELCKVFQLAAVSGVTVMPHTFYHGPGLLAAVQVTAALGTADSVIEWRHSGLAAQVYGAALLPAGGRIPVPQGPGLGMDPDPDVLRAFAADGGR